MSEVVLGVEAFVVLVSVVLAKVDIQMFFEVLFDLCFLSRRVDLCRLGDFLLILARLRLSVARLPRVRDGVEVLFVEKVSVEKSIEVVVFFIAVPLLLYWLTLVVIIGHLSNNL